MDRKNMLVQRTRDYFTDRLDDILHMVSRDRQEMRGWQEPTHLRATVRRAIREEGQTSPTGTRVSEATTTEDAFWEMEWTDAAPGDLVWHEPLVQVEVERDGAWSAAVYDGRAVNDQGWRIGVTYDGPQHGMHRYRARWYGPPLGRPGRHRFVLLANAAQPEVAGPAFD